jgi:glycosyltransferase involved in cell wall biosynthesis
VRILQVNDFRDGGGAELVVAETVRLLREAGHEVELFTGEDVPGRLRPWSYVSNRRAVRALADRVRGFRPDVVHFHNVYHRLSPAVLGVPAPRKILTAHDFHLVCPNAGACAFDAGGRRRVVEPGELRQAGDLLGRRWDHRSAWHGWLRLLQHLWSYRVRRRREQLDVVLCPGEAAAAMLRDAGLPVPVEVVPNPFDAEATRAMATRFAGERPRWPSEDRADPAGSASRPLRLTFVGRVAPEKGLAEVLAAWPADRDAELLAIGDGPDLPRCREVIRSRGLESRVHLAGSMGRGPTLAAIAEADAIILPARTPEVAPLVLTEAVALGTRIIAPPTGAMAEVMGVIAPGAAIDLREPRALQASLARAIDELHQPPTGDVRLEEAAAAFLERRDPAWYRRSLEAVFLAGEGNRTH